MKQLDELINNDEPGIELVRNWIDEGGHQVEILTPSDKAGEILKSLQISTRSPMGAIAYETGGILVENGWLRIRGSGNEKLPRILSLENQFIIIADDAVGGFFALNGGGLGDDFGQVYYASPDTTYWEDLDVSYSEFISWTFTTSFMDFYKGIQRHTWKKDLLNLPPDKCFCFYPFLWSKEGSVETAHMEMVSVEETYNLRLKFINEIG